MGIFSDLDILIQQIEPPLCPTCQQAMTFHDIDSNFVAWFSCENDQDHNHLMVGIPLEDTKSTDGT